MGINEKPKCAECKFIKHFGIESDEYRCRRYPPIDGTDYIHPAVTPYMWCGEFKWRLEDE